MRNPTITFDGDAAILPTISIVTPCRNHARYVETTLRSVLEQGYPKLDYVVIDGGSDDGSAETIEQYADYLTHWQSRPDDGQYHALARGFERASGELMMWLNADDLLARNALWTIAEIFTRFPQVRWLHGLPGHADAAGRVFCSDPPPRWSRLRFLRGDYRWIQQESVVWRRDLWDQAGGRLDLEYGLAADMALWMRFFRHARLYSTTAPLAAFRHTPGQRSRVHGPRYSEEAAQIVAEEVASGFVSDADRAALRRARRFERWWLRLPIVRGSWRVRRTFDRLHDYPPLIDFDQQTGELRMVRQ